jgi:hypothetical protein
MSEPMCPCCNRRAFSQWRKLGIGPLKRVPCESCGVLLSVAWLPSTLVLILGSFAPVLGIVAAISLTSGAISFETALAGFLVSAVVASLPFLWFYARFVPIVVKDD